LWAPVCWPFRVSCFLAIHNNRESHYQAFFLLWGFLVVFASLIAFYPAEILKNMPLQAELAVDGFGVLFLGLAAYVLNRGSTFTWSDKD